MELCSSLDSAVHLFHLQENGHAQGRGSTHIWLEVLQTSIQELFTNVNMQFYHEGMISLVAIEERQPGKITATLCLDSNLGLYLVF